MHGFRLFSATVFIASLLAAAGCEYTKSSPPLGPFPTSPTSASSASSCTSSSPEAVVRCERAKFGHMDREQLVQFLKSVAATLNRSAVGGGPYGVLRKEIGNQCSGYSCDIVCAGDGTSQRQHDVLLDAEGSQEPVWGAPETWPHIRVDICEIQ
jgi:hypothetical protein